MTKDEIKKALEICADDCYSCDDCPYDDVINCGNTLKNDVRELIVEQEKETERLKAEVKQSKLDVLNELREKYSTFGNTFAGWIAFIPADDIDELIEEVEK